MKANVDEDKAPKVRKPHKCLTLIRLGSISVI